MATLKEAALAYAERGLKVFPLKAKSKVPLTAHGFKDASSDPEDVRRWWSEAPGANIGIATGKASGLFVLDVDIDNAKGIDGEQALKDFERERGKLDKNTWLARTGRGGFHLYYQSNGQPTPCTTGGNGRGLAKGLDTKGDGGYIVAPPSQHENGNLYEWIKAPDKPIAPVPDILLNALRESHKHKKEPETTKFAEGSRNDSLFRLAVKAHKDGASLAAIRALLKAQNEECNPPLSQTELNSILNSATRYGDPQKDPIPLVPLTDIVSEEPEWLIEGYIPKYAVTTLAGDGGVGKTTLWCHLAASISAGKRSILEKDVSFFIPKTPGKVIFFSSEDSAKYTLKQRLEANGGDLSNILHLPYESESFMQIKFSEDALENIIADQRPELVIFDPLQGFLDKGTDMGRRNHMRQELEHLTRLCAKYDTTILIVMHSNKGKGNTGRSRMADSADIWDASRSCLFVGFDPETEYRYLAQDKSNHGALQSAVLFSIEQGNVVFQAKVNKRDADFQLTKQYQSREAPKREAAMHSIIEYISENKGQVTVKELDAAMRAYGYSNDVLRRAKEELKQQGILKIIKDKGYQTGFVAKLHE